MKLPKDTLKKTLAATLTCMTLASTCASAFAADEAVTATNAVPTGDNSVIAIEPVLKDSRPGAMEGSVNAGRTGASMDSSIGSNSDVDSVTRALAIKEITLAKLTTDYRVHNPNETKAHKWLTAGISTVAYSVADAGNIVTFTNAFKFRNKVALFHVATAETGPFLIFLGELLFVGRTVSVALLDAVHNEEIKHHGWDRKSFEGKASTLETEIHELLAKRAALIANSSDPALAQEQAVLQDISDGLTKEFIRNYARASRIRAFHLTDNIVANYTSGFGAFMGGLLIYLASTNTNPRLTGPAGIGFCISGTGFILKDFLARRVSQHVEKKTTAKMLAQHKATPDPLASLETDNTKLGTLAGGSGGIASRKAAYDLMATALAKDVDLTKRENLEEYHKYLHDQTINAAEGLANIAAGSILTQAGFGYRSNVNPLYKLQHAKLFLGKFGAAAITFTPTASGGIVDTPAEALYGEYKRHKDCKEGLCPKVGAATRMQLLNQAETAMK